jgi:hypothetical protein
MLFLKRARFWKFGFHGLLISIIASIVELLPWMGDDIAASSVSAALIYVRKIAMV